MMRQRCPYHDEPLRYDHIADRYICKSCYVVDLAVAKASGREHPGDEAMRRATSEQQNEPAEAAK